MYSDVSVLSLAALWIGHSLLAVSGLLSLIRVWIGPTTADRVVALDVFAVLVLGHCVLLAAGTGNVAFFDVALVIAIIAFIATVAIARYLEKGALRG